MAIFATPLARPGLRGILTGTLAVLTAALIFSVTAVVVWTATREAQRSIGRSLADLAGFMREALESDVYERWRNTRTIATIPAFAGRANSYAARRAILDRVKANFEEIVWIGLADTNGRVIVASGGSDEGSDVSERLWFKAARDRASAANENTQRPQSLTPTGERVIEIGSNVRNAEGEVIGRLGMLVSWDWLGHLRRSLIERSRGRQSDLEVMVLDRDGRVIIGDPEHLDPALTLTVARRADGFEIEKMSDGRVLLIGTSRAAGGRGVDGLGWQIVVTSSAEIAFAPVDTLRRQIIAAGGFVGLLVLMAGWWVAGRIASPLQAIAARADRVGLADALDGVVIEVPQSSSKEVVSLAASLQGMIDRLADNEEALRHLANTLEVRVADRTAELETANHALSVARDDAVAATAAKSRFLAAASHDLRQPLHALSLFASALARRVTGDEPRRLVANMETTLSSLQDMFNALLDVSRLDAGIVVAEPRVFVIGDLLERIAAGFRAQAAANGLEFRLVPSRLAVTSDPILIETVLRNLVANALKFTASGGVLVGVRRRGDMAVLEIHDTGTGVPIEDRDRIFEEFERAKQAAHGQNDGLGLGLSIVRRLCNLLGHHVSVASHRGRGTVFRVEMPIAAQPIRVEEARPSAPSVSLAGRHILILDDEPMIVDALARTLRDDGATVTAANSAEEATRALAQALPIDLAVIDLQLEQGIDGLDLVRGWQQGRSTRLPALIVTGATDPLTLARLQSSGIAWMTKPVAVPVLRATVARLVAA
ncbi:hybrid sensor histidine kinase/response regulator [Phreatobacter stygius]|uniref:histidine kinase n=1 Tax=Phreatobacter stygius TaxID=1940610 RepID=A0A4D7AZ19_9HYPH|nr:ATP-binding protein [Phreatobacter stygius]QCI63908.1 response regulator [Phreatobacter stygius]